jgi:hypothetical protein
MKGVGSNRCVVSRVNFNSLNEADAEPRRMSQEPKIAQTSPSQQHIGLFEKAIFLEQINMRSAKFTCKEGKYILKYISSNTSPDQLQIDGL